ncbi:hypothetical protein [Sphingorhabdus sp.]|uniref:hypothetical protein n=1 Tax=Sphingorhabdus sp. TaxID=1902408 RepID=UPI003C78B387
MDSSKIELDQDYRELCMAVGHLFITFSRLEGTLAATLKLHLANQICGNAKSVNDIALSSAIYGGMRFKSARDTIKRIMTTENTPKEVEKFVLSIFEHVGHIETFRDHIAHQTTVPAIEGRGIWQVSDSITTRTIKEPKVRLFTVEAVVSAANDLATASNRLGGHVVGDRLYEDGFEISPVTWQYKSSMLKLVPQNKMRNPPKHAPQRQASRP